VSTDQPKSSGICVVTAGGPYPWIIINALGREFGPIDVVLEEPEPRGAFMKRRAKKIGWLSTIGQFGTMVLVKLGKQVFDKRIEKIVAENGLEEEPKPEHPIHKVATVNSDEFLAAIRKLEPKVMLLNGCRIMRPNILAAVPCPVLNYHAGITPQYRGMNGGYWALASGDADNFGATVHLVDPGVDTGAILYQARARPAADDNIMTYAHRLAAASRGICIDAVRDALSGELDPVASDSPSRQWYHPTVWRYLWTGLTKAVW
jgi:folate-dependent phosphoribosylglycinamide formyltransferase PurN